MFLEYHLCSTIDISRTEDLLFKAIQLKKYWFFYHDVKKEDLKRGLDVQNDFLFDAQNCV